MSKHETGMAYDIAKFDKMVEECLKYGNLYNPANPFISIVAMQQKSADAKQSRAQHEDVVYRLAAKTNEREIADDKIKPLLIRLMANLKSLRLPSQTLDDAKTINRDIQGYRKTTKKKSAETPENGSEGQSGPNTPDVKKISTSHLSYVSRADNVGKMAALLATIPSYASNEDDLKLAAIQQFAAQLKILNDEVNALTAEFHASKATRDEIMYHPEKGMHIIMREVREYVKSVFGHKSPQYNIIKNLVIVPKRPR